MPGALSAAIRRIRATGIVPTNLTAEELARISAGIRERAMFSARVMNAEFLDHIQSTAQAVARGEITSAEGKRTLRQYLRAIGYQAPEGKEGTIEDLSSNARLRLIVRTQAGFARGYGLHAEAVNNLPKRPWMELYRRYMRKEPRDWPLRWRAAGGRLSRGRFLAPVTDPIWTRISDFGYPYPPFAYNSGMWVKTLTEKQAGKKAKPQVKPKLPLLSDDIQGHMLVGDKAIRAQLLQDLGPGYHVQKGILRKKGRRAT